MTFDKLKKGIPNPNEDDKEKKYIYKARVIDKAFNFDKTRVRNFIFCDNSFAPR